MGKHCRLDPLWTVCKKVIFYHTVRGYCEVNSLCSRFDRLSMIKGEKIDFQTLGTFIWV